MQSKVHNHIEHIIRQISILEDGTELFSEKQRRYIEVIHQQALGFIAQYSEKGQQPVDVFQKYLRHDALTPITVIIGYAELLLMQAFGPLNDEEQAAAAHISATARLLHDDLRVMTLLPT